jgi:Flp pilus assembly protein TadD
VPEAPDRASIAVARGAASRPAAARAVELADRGRQPDGLDQSAREALLAGDAAGALRLYEQLSREFPEAPAARLGQALALERLGRVAEARAIYQSLLQVDPEDLDAKIALLGILAERAPDEALQLLRRLVRAHPDDHRLPAQIAMVLARTGDLAGAIGAVRRAAALDPANAGYRANLGALLDRAGQRGAAIEQYQSALELATLNGAPTTQLGAIAARLHHLRQPTAPAAAPDR